MGRRKVKPAVELASDIGSSAADLHGYGYFQTKEALDFLYRVNPHVFDWLRETLNSAHAQRCLKALRAAKAKAAVDPHVGDTSDRPRATDSDGS